MNVVEKFNVLVNSEEIRVWHYPLKQDSKKFSYYINGETYYFETLEEMIEQAYNHLENGYQRISQENPRNDLECEWCKTIKPTTENSIWSIANPAGRVTRLCNNCILICEEG